MKFILFFSLVSIVSISGFVLAEEEITSSDFYHHYLHSSQASQAVDKKVELKPIKASELPSDVLKSFAKSPFGKYTISQAYLIPTEKASNWISQIMKHYSPIQVSEETYVLALNGKKFQTQLRFSKSGKLIKIITT
ncbi:hypothetical protein [Catalinimonas niigatensis]|uniref:hypothetical protein n=1 Tax=Catalinimonas niigatensis TaxID=1397264 RepID=UPI00266586E4|nr:hypothetical protein [Catalinimonas niigatensis]WPP48808.1 hypothetical protein PZB72_19255 [Catalinimonas niigatensis]